MVKQEVEGYAKEAGAILRNSDVDSLLNFSLAELGKELRTLLPTLTAVVGQACARRKEGKRKTYESIQAAVTTVTAKILAIYSNSLSVWRHVSALNLATGGTKDTSINRLAATFDSVLAITLRRKLNSMADVAAAPLSRWNAEGSTFTLVFDNVNKHVKARRQTATHSNTMHNLTHAIAIRDRVDVSGLPTTPLVAVNAIDAALLLPTPDHVSALKSQMMMIVRRLWAQYVPALEWVDCVEPPHKYAAAAQLRTEKVCARYDLVIICYLLNMSSRLLQLVHQVNIGVLKKDECKKEDMLDILKTYHAYVPDRDGDMAHLLLAGLSVIKFSIVGFRPVFPVENVS